MPVPVPPSSHSTQSLAEGGATHVDVGALHASHGIDDDEEAFYPHPHAYVRTPCCNARLASSAPQDRGMAGGGHGGHGASRMRIDGLDDGRPATGVPSGSRADHAQGRGAREGAGAGPSSHSSSETPCARAHRIAVDYRYAQRYSPSLVVHALLAGPSPSVPVPATTGSPTQATQAGVTTNVIVSGPADRALVTPARPAGGGHATALASASASGGGGTSAYEGFTEDLALASLVPWTAQSLLDVTTDALFSPLFYAAANECYDTTFQAGYEALCTSVFGVSLRNGGTSTGTPPCAPLDAENSGASATSGEEDAAVRRLHASCIPITLPITLPGTHCQATGLSAPAASSAPASCPLCASAFQTTASSLPVPAPVSVACAPVPMAKVVVRLGAVSTSLLAQTPSAGATAVWSPDARLATGTGSPLADGRGATGRGASAARTPSIPLGALREGASTASASGAATSTVTSGSSALLESAASVPALRQLCRSLLWEAKM